RIHSVLLGSAVPANKVGTTNNTGYTITRIKSLFSPLSTLTLTCVKGAAVLLVESLAKLQLQRLAPAVLVSQCAKVPATFYCRFYYLGSLGKSGEERILIGTSVIIIA